MRITVVIVFLKWEGCEPLSVRIHASSSMLLQNVHPWFLVQFLGDLCCFFSWLHRLGFRTAVANRTDRRGRCRTSQAGQTSPASRIHRSQLQQPAWPPRTGWSCLTARPRFAVSPVVIPEHTKQRNQDGVTAENSRLQDSTIAAMDTTHTAVQWISRSRVV